MAGLSSRGIFLSYRREDAAPYARLLQFQLSERIPDARVFMDLDSIEPGLDFAEVIREAVDSCAVLVALIGRQWATLTDEEGRRRLDNPDDYVRFEVQTALERGVRVIPVLVDGARPLRQQQLPSELQKLARLNALELSYGRYEYDADRLLNLLQRVLAAASGTATGRQSSPAANVAAFADAYAVRPDGNAHLTAAERIAQSITDDYSEGLRARCRREGTSSHRPRPRRPAPRRRGTHRPVHHRRLPKAIALADIAGALAATDPDRARLIADAERIAQSITDDYRKAVALANIAGALAATDPDRAERTRPVHHRRRLKACALADVAGALAATDPGRAERIAQSITDGRPEGLRTRRRRGGTGSHRPGSARNASPSPSPTTA